MKISLDTKEDSTEDIHKVVRMLQAWLGGNSNSNSFADIFGNNNAPSNPASQASPSSPPEGAFFNMFGDSGSSQSSAQNPERSVDLKTNPDSNDIPEIIPY